MSTPKNRGPFADILGDFFGEHIEDRRLDALKDAIEKALRQQLAARDAEVAELRALVERVKMKAQNNVDRAFNRGLVQGLSGVTTRRVVRHPQFGSE